MENSAGGIDRISNLPDELLCRIISLLPTIKDAFSTTILSKRWGRPFRLLTDLFFKDESLLDKDAFIRFLRFVETVIHSTKLIKTLHIECHFLHWQATGYCIEHLQFLSPFNPITLWPTYFTFPTLVVLKLTNFIVPGNNISVDLPSLKILHLDHVCFANRENFNKLIYGCPILEDLILSLSLTNELKTFTIIKGEGEGVEFKILSNLISAKMDTPHYVPFRAICNVQMLKLGMLGTYPGSKIDSNYREFLVFQNLIHLELYFHIFSRWDNVVQILQGCPKLQILSVEKTECTFDDEASFKNWKYPNYVPHCISSHLRSCSLYYHGFPDELRFAAYILQNAPLLGVMKIIMDHAFLPRDALEELTFCRRISPKCKLSIV